MPPRPADLVLTCLPPGLRLAIDQLLDHGDDPADLARHLKRLCFGAKDAPEHEKELLWEVCALYLETKTDWREDDV